MAAGRSSRESWKRSRAEKFLDDKLEGEGGSSGQSVCAPAAAGYKPEPFSKNTDRAPFTSPK